MIDREFVLNLYETILNDVVRIRSLDQWSIEPVGVEFSAHKSKYGQATSVGKILVNERFLGTEAVEKLKNTIRHELAHCSVGFHNHHNETFKRAERLFGVTDEGEAEDEKNKIINNISYKYTVHAHLVNGNIVCCGGVHRKTKIYTEYDKMKKPMRDRASKVLIERFEFVVNII